MNRFHSILVTGGKGMLASALTALLQRRKLPFVSVDIDVCDITLEAPVKALFSRFKPTLLLNCAAHTRVDAAQQEEGKANAVNGHAVGALAAQAAKYGTKMVHFSTEAVFDGKSARPYRPEDAPAPLSAYGRSKLLGERKLAEVNPPGWLLVRTCWLYGPKGLSFPRTMIERAKAGQPIKVINDQTGAPTYTFDLAAAVLELIERDAGGIWHLCNSGQATWHEFARTTLETFGLRANVESVTTEQWLQLRPKTAPRPRYSVLDNSAYAALTGQPLRPWQEALQDFRRILAMP